MNLLWHWKKKLIRSTKWYEVEWDLLSQLIVLEFFGWLFDQKEDSPKLGNALEMQLSSQWRRFSIGVKMYWKLAGKQGLLMGFEIWILVVVFSYDIPIA